MRLQVAHGVAPELLRFLRRHVDVVAARVAGDALEVSILGSLGAAHDRAELSRRLLRWTSTHPGAPVELVDDDEASFDLLVAAAA